MSWICKKCDTENPDWLKVCEVCDSPRKNSLVDQLKETLLRIINQKWRWWGYIVMGILETIGFIYYTSESYYSWIHKCIPISSHTGIEVGAALLVLGACLMCCFKGKPIWALICGTVAFYIYLNLPSNNWVYHTIVLYKTPDYKIYLELGATLMTIGSWFLGYTDVALHQISKKTMKKIIKIFAVFLAFSLGLSLLITLIEKKGQKNSYSIPVGFEEFADSKAHYRVFAACKDSIHHFKIKAMMIAYIDTINNQLIPTTTYVLKHASGETLKVKINESLMDVDSFRAFVNSHNSRHNDTIIQLTNKYDIEVSGHEYSLEDLYIPFGFLDVSFKGYPSLLIKSWQEQSCTHYDVYGITPKEIHKVQFKPYNQFKTAISNFMGGDGTKIDYMRKEIIIRSLEKGSYADHGVIVSDVYTYDKSADKFVCHREKSTYDAH